MFQNFKNKFKTTFDKEDQKSSQLDQVKLPSDFHERMINCEIQLEQDDISMEVIQELLDLYSNAIEYYGSIQDNKYLYYKNKTQELLIKPNVVKAMNQKTEEIRIATEPEEAYQDQKEEISYSQQENVQKELVQQHKEIKLQLQFLKQQDQQMTANKLLEQEQKIYERNKKMLDKDLENQKDQIDFLRDKIKQQNVLKHGFFQPKPVEQIFEDLKSAEKPHKKLNIFKMSSSQSLKAQKPKHTKDRETNLIDLNFGEEEAQKKTEQDQEIEECEENEDIQAKIEQQERPANVQENIVIHDDDEEDYDDEEDIVFETQNSSDNNSNPVNNNNFHLFSLNSQESPPNKMSKTPNGLHSKFNIFNSTNNIQSQRSANNFDNINQRLSQGDQQIINHSKKFLTPNNNTCNKINLIDFSQEKEQAKQKLQSQQINLNFTEPDLQSSSPQKQEQLPKSNEDLQATINSVKIDSNNDFDVNIKNSKVQKNTDVQIINNGAVKTKKTIKKPKKTNKRRPSNETPENFVIPF